MLFFTKTNGLLIAIDPKCIYSVEDHGDFCMIHYERAEPASVNVREGIEEIVDLINISQE